ncbi:DUF2341 domain-containing protein [Ignicoccus hospitalis]|uniref:DUF2341 domain-containing protein n=1 Tax=Ignicoccus hospitalis (strain KIN4/I / DSM 18386 / JCM 14125) TaxID=453591 RepID=A8AAN6_IGNH4|nr:DUF2341 domain-containing protein [Ignicoccus hospitalis]ABU81988.1 hypothetical protein Igni_0806 [Ignicoccus hospitalis KIN4/I]HIH89853.1 DUF2341 domain-containing protein [Desulfurococcaceae archaeon]
MRRVAVILTLLVAIATASNWIYHVTIYNPNDYNLTEYQVRVELPDELKGREIAITYNNSPVPFCYETTNYECTTDSTKGDGYIWIKVPFIPANGKTGLKLAVGTNGAVNGDQVFDFYDDFNEGQLDTNKWVLGDANYGGIYYSIENGQLATWSDGHWRILRSKDPIGLENAVVEARILNAQDDQWHALYLTDANGDWNRYGILNIWGSDDMYVQVYCRGNYDNDYEELMDRFPLNQWLILRIVKKGTSYWGEVFDNSWNLLVKASKVFTCNDFTEAYIRQWKCYSNKDYWDWVRVRKYADEEPIASVVMVSPHSLLAVFNPNDYDLAEYQLRAQLPIELQGKPLKVIYNGISVPFCYETANDECTADPLKGDGYVWIRVPSIPAKSGIYLIIERVANGAVSGDQVFDFYDDFSETQLNSTKWILGSGTYLPINYKIYDGQLEVWGSDHWSNMVSKEISVSEFLVEAKVMNMGGDDQWNALVIEDRSGNELSLHEMDGTSLSSRLICNGQVEDVKLLDAFPDHRWLTFKVSFNGTFSINVFDQNGNLLASTSLQCPNFGGKFKVEQRKKVNVSDFWDWVRVRKYAEREPIYGFFPPANVTLTNTAVVTTSVTLVPTTLVETTTILSSTTKPETPVVALASVFLVALRRRLKDGS